MKRPTEILLWVLATVVLSGVTAWFVSGGARKPVVVAEPAYDLHDWMHEKLVLTDSQHEGLEPHESAYEKKRQALAKKVSDAGRELAVVIKEGEPESPEVERVLKELHAAQADLQRATLDHFFAMKEHLDPEQAERLSEWLHQSIVHE